MLSPLRIPGIRCLWIGQLVSIAGDYIAIFAVLSNASFRMHATASAITGITIAYMLPLALFGRWSGAIADRLDPKRLMIASDLIRAALALLLLFTRQLGQIYAVLFLLSTVSTFFLPAQSVTIRTIAPPDALPSVFTLMQQTTLTLRLAGPVAAGALVANFGAASCFCLDSVSFLWSAWMISGVSVRALRPPGPRKQNSGLHFILSHRELAFVTAAMAAATFSISCSSPMLAVFARDILHSDIRSFAAISTAIGLGLIAGTQTAPWCAKRWPGYTIVAAGLATTAFAMASIGISLEIVGATAGAFLMGAGAGLLTVPAQTLLQTETPVEMAGRVSSTVTSAIAIAQIAGLILSATLARLVGLRPLFAASATLLGAVAAASRRTKTHFTRRLATEPRPQGAVR